MLEIFINKKRYKSFINYAIDTSDSLSMVFTKDENDISQYILQELYYIVSELIVEKRNIGYHPDTNTEFENSDYIIMRCSKELKPIFFEADNIDNWNGEVFPEELCFYRKKKKWFSYIRHEEKAFVYKESIDVFEYKYIIQAQHWMNQSVWRYQKVLSDKDIAKTALLAKRFREAGGST